MPVNINTPYIECMLRKEVTGLDHHLEGYIFGAKGLINYPLLFHFQGKNGAVMYNQPISSFCHEQDYEIMSEDATTRLSLLESWDCQSNSIDSICYKFLEYKRVDVICRDGLWRGGIYLFTIDDYEGNSNDINIGHSNFMDSKCFHFIQLDNGNFCVQPNNLLRWHNPDFIIPYPKENPPKIKLPNTYISSEHIDRTYGNSAYFFYGKDMMEEPLESFGRTLRDTHV